jgi:hypothetical protein
MKHIETQYELIKILHGKINSHIKEYKKEIDKYNDLISDSFSTQLDDLKQSLLLTYGDAIEIKPIQYGFQVEYVKGVTRNNKYHDVYLSAGDYGFGLDILPIKRLIESNCTLNQGVKIIDYWYASIDDGDNDMGGIQDMCITLTRKYMDSINKTKRVPTIKLN